MTEALGMVEVRGYLGAVAVADAALKAARVHLASSQKIKGGITTIILNGDVAAVQAAVDAAVLVGKQIGTYRSHHVIPRPDKQSDQLFAKVKLTPEKIESIGAEVEAEQSLSSTEEKSDLVTMKVVDLRKLALKQKDFPLNSKEIKFANKAQLIEALEKIDKTGGKK